MRGDHDRPVDYAAAQHEGAATAADRRQKVQYTEPSRPSEPPRHGRWLIVARKEFADLT